MEQNKQPGGPARPERPKSRAILTTHSPARKTSRQFPPVTEIMNTLEPRYVSSAAAIKKSKAESEES